MTPEEFHAEWCVDEYRQEACRRGEDCEMMKQLRSTINLQIDELRNAAIEDGKVKDILANRLNDANRLIHEKDELIQAYETRITTMSGMLEQAGLIKKRKEPS